MKKIILKSNSSVITLSAKGAELISWIQNGKESIHDGVNFWNKSAPILFPYIGSSIVKKRKKHGFVREKLFEIKEINLKKVIFKTNLSNEWKDVDLEVSYFFKGEDLVCEFKITNNTTQNIKYKIGWHPAFKLNSEISNYKFNYYSNSHKINKNGNITGEVEKITPEKINDEFFKNNDTIIYKGCQQIKMENKNHTVYISSDLKILAIWKPYAADFICLEPWSDLPEHSDLTLNEFSTIKPKKVKIFKTKARVIWS